MNANFHFTLMGTRTYKSDRAYHANPYKKADKKMRKKVAQGRQERAEPVLREAQ